MSKEIYTINQYGKIEIHVKEYMEAKGITGNALVKAIHIRFQVVDRWYKHMRCYYG